MIKPGCTAGQASDTSLSAYDACGLPTKCFSAAAAHLSGTITPAAAAVIALIHKHTTNLSLTALSIVSVFLPNSFLCPKGVALFNHQPYKPAMDCVAELEKQCYAKLFFLSFFFLPVCFLAPSATSLCSRALTPQCAFLLPFPLHFPSPSPPSSLHPALSCRSSPPPAPTTLTRESLEVTWRPSTRCTSWASTSARNGTLTIL